MTQRLWGFPDFENHWFSSVEQKQQWCLADDRLNPQCTLWLLTFASYLICRRGGVELVTKLLSFLITVFEVSVTCLYNWSTWFISMPYIKKNNLFLLCFFEWLSCSFSSSISTLIKLKHLMQLDDLTWMQLKLFFKIPLQHRCHRLFKSIISV